MSDEMAKRRVAASSEASFSPFVVVLIFGTAIGAVFGFSVAFGIWAYPPFLTDDTYRDWIGAIATLMGALATLLAAGLTVWIVNRQIQESRHAYDDQIKRRAASARAFLPIDLAEFSQSTEQCFKDNFAISLFPPPYIKLENYKVPEITLSNIKNIVEYSSNNEAQHFIELIKKYQICSSRINTAGNGTTIFNINIINYCIDLLDILELIDDLYPYARGQQDSIHRTEQLHRMLGRVGFLAPYTLVTHPIYSDIQRRFENR